MTNNFNNETLNILQLPVTMLDIINTATVKIVPKYHSGDVILPNDSNDINKPSLQTVYTSQMK